MATLEPILEAALSHVSASEELQVLDVGCGSSQLAFELWKQGQRRRGRAVFGRSSSFFDGFRWFSGRFRRVCGVDVDGAVVRAQRERYASHEGLVFEEVDVAREALGQEVYDFAVDKGTMDYFLCQEPLAALDLL